MTSHLPQEGGNPKLPRGYVTATARSACESTKAEGVELFTL